MNFFQLKNWTLWKQENLKEIQLENGEIVRKFKKVPIIFDIESLSYKKYNFLDKNNLKTYYELQKELEKIRKENIFEKDLEIGLGFVFLKNEGYFGIDIDFEEDITKISELFKNTYIEKSVSKKGYHILGKTDKDFIFNKRQGNIEVYTNDRFFVFTNDRVNENEIIYFDKESLQEKIDIIFNSEVITFNNKYEKFDFITKNGFKENIGFKSKSECDFFYMCELIRLCNKNEEEVKKRFYNSKLNSNLLEKGKNYIDITYNNALNSILREEKEKEIAQEIEQKIKSQVFKYEEIKNLDFGTHNYFANKFNIFVENKFKNNKTNKEEPLMYYNGKYYKTNYNEFEKEFERFIEIAHEFAKDNMLRVDKNEFASEKETKNALKEQTTFFKTFIKNLNSQNFRKSIKESFLNISSNIVEETDFNKGEYLINTLNGVLNLKVDKENIKDKNVIEISKELEIIPHSQEQQYNYCVETKINFEKPENWFKFLKSITLENKEYEDYLQKIIGYSILGHTNEQSFFILYGDGMNGKSVFLEVIKDILGEKLAKTMSINTIIENNVKKDGSTASPDLVRLNNARVVITSESERNTSLKEALVKNLTGGEKITARGLFKAEIEFKPQFKIFMATNNRPKIQGADKGIWRRIRLLPFELKLEESQVDRFLTQKLLDEKDKIFGWVIQGCVKYQLEGLEEPKFIQELKEDYKKENSTIERFIEDYCEEPKLVKANNENVGLKNYFADSITYIYKVYEYWCKENGQKTLNKLNFSKQIESKGYEKLRDTFGFFITDIRIKSELREELKNEIYNLETTREKTNIKYEFNENLEQ